MITRTLIAAALLSLSLPAHAAGRWEPATITRISVDANGIAYINVTPTAPVAGTASPPCSINGFWETAFDATTLAGQAMLSLAISAKLSGNPVRLIGSGQCSAFASIEDTQSIDILPTN